MQLIINSLRPSSGNEYSLAGFYVKAMGLPDSAFL